MMNVKFIVKKPNNEVKRLINDEKTLNVLFETGLPDTKYMDFRFDNELKVSGNYIIVGNHNGNNIVIDLENNGAIYTSGSDDQIFLNSSLSQFSQYIILYADFMNKKIKDPSGRNKYVHEWGKEMIEIDKDSYYNEEYWWGSLIEQYENGALM